MSTLGDEYILDRSKSSLESSVPFKSSSWGFLLDSNQGNYASNQAIFDLTGLYNSGKFVSPSEMFLTVPIVAVLSTDEAQGLTGQNDYAVAFKSGFHHIVSSMSVQYQNRDIIQITPFSNYHVSFKLHQKMTQDELETIGASIGVAPDNHLSWKYSDATIAPSATGSGSTNNNNSMAFVNVAQTYQGEQGNSGMLKRQMGTSLDLSSKGANLLMDESNLQTILKSYTKTATPNAQGQYAWQAWYMTAVIRLSDLSDFFDKCPMTKGFYSRIIFNLNQASCAIAKTANAAEYKLSGSSIVAANGTFPLMIAPAGTVSTTATATQLVLGAYVGRVGSSLGTINQSTLGVPSHPLNSCRIYAKSIELQPEIEQSYLSVSRRKLVKYSDLLSYQILNIQAGATVNQNLANSIMGAKSLVIIPFISAQANGLMSGTSVSPYSPTVSPFASEPATSSPLVAITNFNVQLSNKNCFNLQMQFGFEQFIEETRGSGDAVNGGSLSASMVSGIIDQLRFENNFKYYVCDLERRLKDDISPKSVSITFTNASKVACDYYVFIEYQREVVLDCETGALLQ